MAKAAHTADSFRDALAGIWLAGTRTTNYRFCRDLPKGEAELGRNVGLIIVSNFGKLIAFLQLHLNSFR